MIPWRRALGPPALLLALAVLMAATSDVAQPGMPPRFVAAGLAAGATAWWAARTFGGGARAFWIVAILLRVVMLVGAEPGDDLRRYRWEGRVQLAGFSPYALPPNAPELTALRDAEWAGIDHRQYPTAYPPAAQLVFRALAATGAGPWLWKLVFGAADLATAAVLAHWLGRRRAVWYAWNPLAAYAFAGGAHFDSLMVLPMTAALYLLDRAGGVRSEKWISEKGIPGRTDARRNEDGNRSTSPLVTSHFSLLTSAFLLGIAVAFKLIPIVLAPLWAFALGWPRTGGWRAWAIPSLILVPWLGLAPLYGWPHTDVFSGLRAFGNVARTNDALWWLTERLVWSNPHQRNDVYQLLMAAACLTLGFVFAQNWRRGVVWVLGAALLLSPALHPWYVTWMLPLAAWHGGRARAWFIFAASIFGYFLLWEQPLPWRQPEWQRVLILLPPLAWLVVAGRKGEVRSET